eukprot:696337-Prorocentrum_minimum.AAC.2
MRIFPLLARGWARRWHVPRLAAAPPEDSKDVHVDALPPPRQLRPRQLRPCGHPPPGHRLDKRSTPPAPSAPATPAPSVWTPVSDTWPPPGQTYYRSIREIGGAFFGDPIPTSS